MTMAILIGWFTKNVFPLESQIPRGGGDFYDGGDHDHVHVWGPKFSTDEHIWGLRF